MLEGLGLSLSRPAAERQYRPPDGDAALTLSSSEWWKEPSMPELKTLMTGISFGEQPRWHENRLWFSDWGAREVIAVDLDGNSEVILRAPSFPCCVDWLPDGRLLLVSARDGLLLRREPDGTLVTHGDLNRVSKPAAGNELVVDGRGNAYVNGGGFDLMAGEPFAPGIVALVTLDGSARQVADGLAFPNGMLVTADNATLIVAESYAKRISAFDIAARQPVQAAGMGRSWRWRPRRYLRRRRGCRLVRGRSQQTLRARSRRW
jgi:sugar lactone lactonase YvrE